MSYGLRTNVIPISKNTPKFRYTMLNNILKMHILKQKVAILRRKGKRYVERKGKALSHRTFPTPSPSNSPLIFLLLLQLIIKLVGFGIIFI